MASLPCVPVWIANRTGGGTLHQKGGAVVRVFQRVRISSGLRPPTAEG